MIRYRKSDKDAEWSTEVMLYEIYDQWPKDGVVVCFTDGHSELIADQNRFECSKLKMLSGDLLDGVFYVLLE